MMGYKKIKMAHLKSLYESLGFQEVQTYIQSGNVIFQSEEANSSNLEKLIFDKISVDYDFEVPNLILTPQNMEKIINNNPFPEPEKTYFIFLDQTPAKENIRKLNELDFSPEQYHIKEKVIYLYPPNGYGRAKMNNNFFEQKLKVTATTRNLNTVKKLLEMSKFTS